MSEYQYNKVTPEIIAELEAATECPILTGDAINEDFYHDEMSIYGKAKPEVVVEVKTTEDVAAIVKICNDHKIPVTASGARTALTGAAVAIAGGVMISTTKMNKILEYNLDDFSVRLQPGVLLDDLAADAEQHGLMYPPDPGERFATLGGNVSTNAGGMRACKYGCTRDYVRAITVVLASGEITHMGASVSKTSTGYSLLNLMIGSEGTLGIVTEITMKLIPKPKEYISIICPYESLDDCIATVPKFFMANLAPQALEFMEKDVVEETEEFKGKVVYPHNMNGVEVKAYLLASFDGNTMDELYEVVEKAAELAIEAGAIDVLVADTDSKKADAWSTRSALLECIEENTELLDECDVVVPISKIAPFLTYVKSLEAEADFRVRSFGHAGDGNLHIYCCANDMEEDEFKKQVDVFMKECYAKAKEFGGLISGEHGIGLGKMDYLKDYVGDTSIAIMKGIKEVFDPNMILNPGKICYKL